MKMTAVNYHQIQQRIFFFNSKGTINNLLIPLYLSFFSRKSAPIFSETNLGYPYLWIQQLCKIQMVSFQRHELVCDCTEIMKRLTQRMRARIALDRILCSFEKSEMPLLAEGTETTSILNSSINRSINNLSTFRSWREISFDDIDKFDFVQILLQENLFDRLTTSIYECKFQSLIQDENNKINLYAYVFIPANYPQARSMIFLKLMTIIHGNRVIERTRNNNENIKVSYSTGCAYNRDNTEKSKLIKPICSCAHTVYLDYRTIVDE